MVDLHVIRGLDRRRIALRLKRPHTTGAAFANVVEPVGLTNLQGPEKFEPLGILVFPRPVAWQAEPARTTASRRLARHRHHRGDVVAAAFFGGRGSEDAFMKRRRQPASTLRKVWRRSGHGRTLAGLLNAEPTAFLGCISVAFARRCCGACNQGRFKRTNSCSDPWPRSRQRTSERTVRSEETGCRGQGRTNGWHWPLAWGFRPCTARRTRSSDRRTTWTSDPPPACRRAWLRRRG